MKKFILIFSLFLSLYTSAQERIQMQTWKGVYTIPCTVNGLKLRFVFDTGAAAVSISAIEATFMLKNEYLSEDDIIGTQEAILADGSISENVIINLKEIKIGSKTLKDVKALVSSSQEAPLLLGQSAISLLGKWQMSGDMLILGDSAPEIPEDIDAAVKQYETRGDLASAYNLLKNAIAQDDYKSYEKWISFVDKNKQLLHTAKVEIDDDLLAQLLFEAVMADYAPLAYFFKNNAYYLWFVKDKTKIPYYYEALFNKGYHIAGKHIAQIRYINNNISFDKYIYYLESSAKLGDIESCKWLGSAYNDGEFKLFGKVTDIAKSLYWYKKAADKNDSEGQYLYAVTLLQQNNLSSEQKSEAISYLKKAANNGDTDAISELVTEYFYGGNVNKNYDTTIFWAKKLESDWKYKWWANAYIGWVYHDKKDYSKAIQYFSKAVDIDKNPPANTMVKNIPTYTRAALGEIYFLGSGIAKDYDKALDLLLKEIEVSDSIQDAYIYSYIAQIYNNDGNYRKAFPYIKFAAEHGDYYCQGLMALYYTIGETTEGKNYTKAEQWALKAIKNASSTVADLGLLYRFLGNVYSFEDSELYDMNKTIANYEKASAYNDCNASYLLGEIYENGEGGIDKNFKLAEKYYRLAAEQGHEKAKEKLRLFQ